MLKVGSPVLSDSEYQIQAFWMEEKACNYCGNWPDPLSAVIYCRLSNPFPCPRASRTRANDSVSLLVIYSDAKAVYPSHQLKYSPSSVAKVPQYSISPFLAFVVAARPRDKPLAYGISLLSREELPKFRISIVLACSRMNASVRLSGTTPALLGSSCKRRNLSFWYNYIHPKIPCPRLLRVYRPFEGLYLQ